MEPIIIAMVLSMASGFAVCVFLQQWMKRHTQQLNNIAAQVSAVETNVKTEVAKVKTAVDAIGKAV